MKFQVKYIVLSQLSRVNTSDWLVVSLWFLEFELWDRLYKKVIKVAPYSFRSVSRKFRPRARSVVLHATCVVEVTRVAGFLKLRRDIHASLRGIVGWSREEIEILIFVTSHR
jgi:hypothetical protein